MNLTSKSRTARRLRSAILTAVAVLTLSTGGAAVVVEVQHAAVVAAPDVNTPWIETTDTGAA